MNCAAREWPTNAFWAARVGVKMRCRMFPRSASKSRGQSLSSLQNQRLNWRILEFIWVLGLSHRTYAQNFQDLTLRGYLITRCHWRISMLRGFRTIRVDPLTDFFSYKPEILLTFSIIFPTSSNKYKKTTDVILSDMMTKLNVARIFTCLIFLLKRFSVLSRVLILAGSSTKCFRYGFSGRKRICNCYTFASLILLSSQTDGV